MVDTKPPFYPKPRKGSGPKPGHSYRAARRNRARDLGYLWSKLRALRPGGGHWRMIEVPFD